MAGGAKLCRERQNAQESRERETAGEGTKAGEKLIKKIFFSILRKHLQKCGGYRLVWSGNCYEHDILQNMALVEALSGTKLYSDIEHLLSTYYYVLGCVPAF